MRQILVIHGGNFFESRKEYLESLKKEEISKEDLFPRQKRWKDNLGNDLGKGFEVFNPGMPNGDDAKYIEWKVFFEKFIPFLNDGVVLIGHSLGGIFLARYLSENILSKKIKGLFLVAAPFFKPDKKRGMAANAGFSVKNDLKKIERQVEHIFIYHSSDDPVVPVADAKIFTKLLPKAKFVEFTGRGHFREEHFSEIVDTIKQF